MTKNNSSISNTQHLPILLLSIFVALMNSCVISPIYVQIESNIAFEYTLLPLILNYTVLLFDTLYISFLTAVLAYSVYGMHNGFISKKSTYIYLVSIVILKHVLNLSVSSVIDSYIDVTFDIPMTLVSIVIDLLILAIIAIIANNTCKKHCAHVRAMLKASKYLETVDYDQMEDVFPFKGFFKFKKNPVLIPAFAGAVITSILFIVQRLFADFVVLGAPSTVIELIDIFVSYIGDIVFGLISYTASYFSLYFIFLRSKQS